MYAIRSYYGFSRVHPNAPLVLFDREHDASEDVFLVGVILQDEVCGSELDHLDGQQAVLIVGHHDRNNFV